jgi:TPR repeat protein
VDKDDKEAARWFRHAADKGNAGAQYQLGLMYAKGQGVAKDDKEAVAWYRKAADQGHEMARKNLAAMPVIRKETDKTEKEVIDKLRAAAERGEAAAQYHLGIGYLYGRGVKKNDKEAARWLRKAAEQGDARSQHDLGTLYANGTGVEKDDKEAVKWYRQSAEKEWPEGESALGYMYEVGRGVPRDVDEARKWYEKAAARGLQQARDRLARLETTKLPAKDPPKRLAEPSLFQMFRFKGTPLIALALPGKGAVTLYNEKGVLGHLISHTGTVTCAAFTTDGTRGVTGSKDRTALVWDMARRQSILRLKGHTNAIAAVAISPDGKSALSADGPIVHVWDLKKGRRVGRLPHELPVTGISYLRNGLQAVCTVDTKGVGAQVAAVYVWNLATLARIQTIPNVRSAAFAIAPDGLLVSGTSTGDVIRLSLPNNRPTIDIRRGPPNLQRVSFSANSRFVLFEAGRELRVFSIPDNMRMVTSVVQKDATRGPYAASLDKDGANLTYADRNSDGTVTFKTIATTR